MERGSEKGTDKKAKSGRREEEDGRGRDRRKIKREWQRGGKTNGKR